MNRLHIFLLMVLPCSSIYVPSEDILDNSLHPDDESKRRNESQRRNVSRSKPGAAFARLYDDEASFSGNKLGNGSDLLNDLQDRAAKWHRPKRPLGPRKNDTDTERTSAKTRSKKNYRAACHFGVGCFDNEMYGLGFLPDPTLTVETFFLMYRR